MWRTGYHLRYNSVVAPTHALARWLFLRLLGLVYFLLVDILHHHKHADRFFAHLMSDLQENLSGIHVVKAYVREQEETEPHLGDEHRLGQREHVPERHAGARHPRNHLAVQRQDVDRLTRFPQRLEGAAFAAPCWHSGRSELFAIRGTSRLPSDQPATGVVVALAAADSVAGARCPNTANAKVAKMRGDISERFNKAMR